MSPVKRVVFVSLAAVAAVCAAAVLVSAGRTAPPAPARLAAHLMPSRTAGDGVADQVRRGELAQQIARARQAAAPAVYTVRAGDSLSAIAGRVYRRQAAWPVLYWSNRGTIRWASRITTGQTLQIPAEPAAIPAAPRQLEPAPPPRPLTVAAAYTPGRPAAASRGYRPAAFSSGYRRAAASPGYQGAAPGGSFGACVIARESGGNAQVMNSSGHYGLYQFSASTWAAYGGSSADFGHAGAGEQNQVFANAIARGGQSNWSPYDGC